MDDLNGVCSDRNTDSMAKVVEAASALSSIQKHRKNTIVYSRENILFRGMTMERSKRGSADLGSSKRHAGSSGQVLPEGYGAVTTASNIDELETIQPDCSFFGTI